MPEEKRYPVRKLNNPCENCVDNADCDKRREECRRFQEERDRRYGAEVRAIHSHVEKATSAIKEVMLSIREENKRDKESLVHIILSREEIEEILDDRLKIALDSASCRDKVLDSMQSKPMVDAIKNIVRETLSSKESGDTISSHMKIAMNSTDMRDLTKGILTIPVVMSILAASLIIGGAWFSFKVDTDARIDRLSEKIATIESDQRAKK